MDNPQNVINAFSMAMRHKCLEKTTGRGRLFIRAAAGQRQFDPSNFMERMHRTIGAIAGAKRGASPKSFYPPLVFSGLKCTSGGRNLSFHRINTGTFIQLLLETV